MLSIKNLNLTFDEKGEVFKNITMELEENTVTLLSGKSGCGKSSLLMCITGVIPEIIEGTLSGEITYMGRNIKDLGLVGLAGDIAYMFQDPDSQLCTFTVEDEIAFGLENMKIEPSEMDNIIHEVLNLVSIEHLRKRKLNELSGGEKQKVALASILALNPKMILMDEPTANLDPHATVEIIELIKKLKEDMGKTILIVEHKIHEFIDIVDNVLEINNGETKFLSKAKFLEDYDKEFDFSREPLSNKFSSKVMEVKNLSFEYNKGNEVLKDINFSLGKGEIAAIIGCNGAGKSTLSKILMGLLKPKSGDIILNGQNMKNISTKDIGKNMGLVFQNPEHQFIKMTVEKEISLGLEINGKEKNEIDTKVEEYLKRFDLEDSKLRNPFTLSQGQKRRLSTASMMINGQEILILDEPTYGQDRENLKKLIELLYEINKEGTSILMITHDMKLVSKCCDKIIYLKNGKIDYEGSYKEGIEEFFGKGISI